MTRIHQTYSRCGICHTSIKHNVIFSGISFGSPDLDLRPPGPERHTMDMWLRECTKCGYVSRSIEEVTDSIREVVKGAEYSALHGGPLAGTLANRFLKASLISESLGNRRDAGMFALCAAWAADDVGDRATARAARLKTAEHFLNVLSSMEEHDPASRRAITLKTQTVDVLRRSGRWGDAEKLADSISEQPIDADVKAVINFQKSLLRHRNDSPHGLDDIVFIEEQKKCCSR